MSEDESNHGPEIVDSNVPLNALDVLIRKSNRSHSLKEFGEVPKGYESAFFYVKNEYLDKLGQTGVTPDMNTMSDRAKEESAGKSYNVEEVFEEVRLQQDISASRLTCQFAFATEQEAIDNSFGFDPEEYTLIEAKIDPKKARVADGELLGKANMYGNEATARTFAEEYWERSVSLADYLNGDHDLPDNGFTEVLAPGEIPAGNMRIVGKQE